MKKPQQRLHSIFDLGVTPQVRFGLTLRAASGRWRRIHVAANFIITNGISVGVGEFYKLPFC